MTDKWTIVILWVFLYHTESNTSGLSQNYNNVIGTRCSEWFFLINIARYFSTWRKFRSLADDIAWSESLVFLIIGLFHAIFLQFNFDYLWKESHQKKNKRVLTGFSNCFGSRRYKIIKLNSKTFLYRFI